MVIVEISIIPIGTKSTSLSSFVAKAVGILKKKKVKHQLSSMGTIIEAENWEQALSIAKEMHESAFKEGAARVVTNIKIDDRRDRKASISQKMKSVEEKI